MTNCFKNFFQVTSNIKKVRHDIVIGIDFGSSSSKIMIQDDYSKNPPIIVSPQKKDNNFPVFAFPTRVAIKDNKIYFCETFEDSFINFSYLKVCLLCKNSSNCNSCPFGQKIISSGKIFKPIGTIDIQEMVTIFLAFLISTAKSKIKESLIDEYIEPKFFYHIGAPLDKIDSEEKKIFEECLFWAKIMTSQINIESGTSFSDLHNLYCTTKSQNSILPEEEQRDFFVLPESYSAIVTYLSSPIAKKGLYSIVDIGASTTDISVFWYTPEQFKSYFYRAETYRIGCNDIDRRILEALQFFKNSDENILFKIQQARHSLFNGKESSHSIKIFENLHIERGIVAQKAKEIGKEIGKNFRKTLGLAWKKEQRDWHRLNIFVIGGGARVKELIECLKIPFNKDISDPNKNINTIFPDIKLDFKESITPFEKKIKDDDLLWVAKGLSIHIRKWVQYFPPSTVEPLRRVVKKFNAEERLRQYDG